MPAGIDVGGGEHWVAISPDRDPDPVRCFGCFTADLREMARWLVEKDVRSVAMQSTGVYWMPVFEILEQHGLRVSLVNAQHTKSVPGRKSDVQECQWLLKLHAFGLLNNETAGVFIQMRKYASKELGELGIGVHAQRDNTSSRQM